MLEEYMCLGGNEIVNNARTYGYARTANCPLSWFRCEPCETLHDAVNDWIPAEYRWVELARNLATNPSFEATSGTIEVRRNYVVNPSLEVDATGWANGGANGSTARAAVADAWRGAAVLRLTRINTTAGNCYMRTSGLTLATGSHTVSAYVRGGSGATRLQMLLANGTAVISGTTVATVDPLPATWTRVSLSVTVTTAGTVDLIFRDDGTTTPLAGMTYDIDGVMIEASSTLGTYFDGANRPRIRENLAKNPSLEGDASSWAAWSSATLSRTTAQAHSGAASLSVMTPGAVAGEGAETTLGNTPVAGDVWSASAWVLAPLGATINASLRSNSGGTWDAVTSITGTGAWQKVTVQGNTTNASNPTGVRFMFRTTGSVQAITFYVDEVIIERAATVGSYFDGATPPADGSGLASAWSGTANTSASYVYDPDLTAAWTGTANASASTLTGVPTTGQSLASGRVAYASTRWASVGSKSIRISTGAVTNGDTFVTVPTAGLQAGKTYTISARLHLLAPQVSTGSGARKIIVQHSGASQIQSVAAPNVAGDHDVTLVADIPSNATGIGLRLYNGTSAGANASDVWWDGLTVIEGPYDGEYFDGDTPDADGIYYSWKGTANASASVQEEYQIVREGYSAEPPYEWGNISRAPWYDAQNSDLTSRFYGPWLIAVEGIDDSTRTATVTEAILDGGVVGLVRHASREVRVRAMLPADGRDALEYGMSWLSAALEADGCSSHGAACGAVDMTFMSSCPSPVDPEDLTSDATKVTRHLHNVTVTSGPLITDFIKSNDGKHVAYIVEWTMVAGTPFVFSETREVALEPSVPVVIQDVPYNLVPVPSAELGTGTNVTIATNYSTNPSLEVNATGWTAGGTVITPTPTGARSTELAAAGTASYKVSTTATNTSTNGTMTATHDITLPAGTGIRYSATVWAAAFVVSGTAVLGNITFQILWRDASTTLRTDTIGTGVLNGGTISAKSIVPPTGAITARIVVTSALTSWSTGAVLNLFVDAVAVTVP